MVFIFYRTPIQCASWCTDLYNCRAFQWVEEPEYLCSLFEDNGICIGGTNDDDTVTLFVGQDEVSCDCEDIFCGPCMYIDFRKKNCDTNIKFHVFIF